MAFQIGDTFGDYEVVGFLGRGGMGQVYKVRHRILDRLDAMKVLLPDCADDPQLRQRFEREIRVQASLQHPHIAALHTALWVDNRLLMIIEFVDGVTLEQKFGHGPLSVRSGVDCMCQVLDALNYAHARGVIHRDVKPGNIMLTADGTVKLTDFGIARTAHESLTRHGIAVGSLYYMSPEQIRTGAIDGRSDLYSVGVTLYEILMGRRPFRGSDDQAIINAHLGQAPERPSDIMPGFPEPLSNIILKSLAKDPADRFQTAGEFRAALAPLLDLVAPSSGGRSVPAQFDPAILSHMEKCLAVAIGPIAKALTTRAARHVENLAALRQMLAEQIPEEAARQKFIRCCERHTGETTRLQSTTAAKPPTVREWNPEFLAKAERELARYIGPLAKIVVQKSSKKAQTPTQLIDMLSGEIPDSKGKEAFASQLRKAHG